MSARMSFVIEFADGTPLPSVGPHTMVFGGRVVAFAVGDRLIEPSAASDDLTRLLDGMSPRERQVAALLASGHKAPAIGRILGISPKTANSYRYRIQEHLGVSNDVQVAMMMSKAMR